jgi:hypothetical protein
MGELLARHRTTENLTPQQQAEWLGIPLGKLAWLAFCQTPRQDISFAEPDLDYLVERTGADRIRLWDIIEQAVILGDWASASPLADTATGWLLAAHDKDQPLEAEGNDDAPADKN